MIGLTDEEITDVAFRGQYNWEDLHAVRDAQVKKFMGWLKSEVLEDCHEGYSNVMCFHRRALKVLLEEVKNE